MFTLRSAVAVSQRSSLARISKAFVSTSTPETTSKSSPASASSTSTSTSAELYLTPEKWSKEKPERIISLFWERKAKLGPEYKRTPEELSALLSTAEYSGMTQNEVRKIYDDTTNAMGTSMVSKQFLRQGLRPFQFDELPSPAQDIVDEHREQRYYNRLAVYDLPLLAQYRQTYKNPPVSSHPVTYRYTSYVGEEHPNAVKVVLSVKTADLGLEPKALHKLRLLARTRYDHETDVFKMSSDSFPEAAQNARYLHDTLQRLLAEFRDLKSDDFNDVPLDTRHTARRKLRKRRNDYKFPEEWKRPQDAPAETVNVVDRVLRTTSPDA